MKERSGSCLCGAVKFVVVGEPLAVRVCWCRDCQHIAAHGTVNMLVPVEALSITGPLSEFTKAAQSGNLITRQFCPSCGVHLFSRSNAAPHMRGIRVGNLDEPSSVSPQMTIWTSSAPNWACFNQSIPQATHQPPLPQPNKT